MLHIKAHVRMAQFKSRPNSNSEARLDHCYKSDKVLPHGYYREIKVFRYKFFKKENTFSWYFPIMHYLMAPYIQSQQDPDIYYSGCFCVVVFVWCFMDLESDNRDDDDDDDDILNFLVVTGQKRITVQSKWILSQDSV